MRNLKYLYDGFDCWAEGPDGKRWKVRNHSGPVDIDGNPVKHTKYEYPYSYDCHVIWRGGSNSEWDEAVYHDRLRGWNSNAYDHAWEKHLKGKGFRSPTAVQNFLREYFNNPNLRLVVIQEGANRSTGYEYWVFHYSNGEKDGS